MTRIATAAILLLLTAALPAADLTLPETVEGPVGSFITVPAETDGEVVRWHAIDAGLNLFPVDLLKSSRTAVVTSPRAGRFRLLAYTAIDNVPSDPAIVTVIVGDPAPEPGPTPDPQPDPDDDDPEPTPDDKAPFPADGLTVLFIVDDARKNELSSNQRSILWGAETRDLLNSRTIKGPDGKTNEWRIWYDNVDPTAAGEPWIAARKAADEPPDAAVKLVISNGTTGYNGPLNPEVTPAQFREILSKY